MKKTAGFVAAGLLSALFIPAANAHAPLTGDFQIEPTDLVGTPFAPQYPQSNEWGIEHEEQIRQDIKKHLHFMKNKQLHYYVGDVPENIQALADLLDGACNVPPTLADYAWAANYVTYVSGSEIDSLEHDIESYKRLRRAPNEDMIAKKVLLAEVKTSHGKVARWIWELNNAFVDKFPEAGQFVQRLQDKEIVRVSQDSVAYTVGAEQARNIVKGTDVIQTRFLRPIFAPYSSLRADRTFDEKIKTMLAFEAGKKAFKDIGTTEEYMKADEENRAAEFWKLQNSISAAAAYKKPAP